MGTFLSITYELHFVETESKRKAIKRVVNYITDNLGDMIWQESISNQLRREERHHSTLFIVLRLFHKEEVEEGKLKSYARYKKKDDELIIDQMFVLSDYTDLAEDEMREKLCNDIYDYVSKMLEKYRKRFLDFDTMAFIPLLKEKMEQTKRNELPYYDYENE